MDIVRGLDAWGRLSMHASILIRGSAYYPDLVAYRETLTECVMLGLILTSDAEWRLTNAENIYAANVSRLG